MNKPLPLVLIGGGGHASVLADILLNQGREIIAVICPDDISSRAVLSGIPHFIRDDDIKCFCPSSVLLVNGIGIMPRSRFRQQISQKFLAQHYIFETIVADDAKVSRFADIKPGAQILTRAVIQSGATISENSIVNSGAIIEHDCDIGPNSHIAPNATLCGNVVIGSNVFVGPSSVIASGVVIASDSVIGAGASIVRDVRKGQIVVPAGIRIKQG